MLPIPENNVMDMNNVMRMVYHKEDYFMVPTHDCDTSSEVATSIDVFPQIQTRFEMRTRGWFA